MKRILMMHTGGTLAMMPEKPKKTLQKSDIAERITRHVPELREIAEMDYEMLFNMDSSNMQIENWQQIAGEIAVKMDDYDGFVITHGTDAMVYTAAALSFMLQNLPKPVILTGSQRPLAEIRSDARTNIINAVDFATFGIPEVCIFFGTHLYRGNRAVKISNMQFDAFQSPNFPPIAEVGTEVVLSDHFLKPAAAFALREKMSDEVLAVRFFPGLNPQYLNWLIENPAKAVVIQALGYGNVSVEKKSLLDLVSQITAAGKLVVITSQSLHARVDLLQYENGYLIKEAGAIGAGDMTVDATIVKLMHLLGYYSNDLQKVRELLRRPIAGEISEGFDERM